MVVLSRRKGVLPYRIVWFDERPRLRFWPITVYYQSPVAATIRGLVRRDFWTYHHDLTLDPTEWMSGMNSTTRNEIRQAEKLSLTVESVDRRTFGEFFGRFAAEKGIDGVSSSKLESFGESWDSTAVKLGARVLAMHACVVDPQVARARLLFSASDRFEDKEDRNLVGKANRFLHWVDLHRYRDRGFRVYDWGGFAKDSGDPVKIGINQFKAAFGGREVCEYHYYPWFLSNGGEST